MMTPQEKRMNHEQYKEFVDEHFAKLEDMDYEAGSEIFRLKDFFSFLDLDKAVDIIANAEVNNKKWVQVKTGRTSKDPACMFRAILMARLLRLRNPEALAEKLENTTYAAICGFDTGADPTDYRYPPGASTIRDFCKRLWNSPTSSIATSNIREPHAKPQRPLVDGEKADPIEKDTCEDRIRRYEDTSFELAKEAFGPIVSIFYEIGLKASRDRGVIPPEIEHMAGDGTPIQILARERSFRCCLVENPDGVRCPCKDRKTRSDCPYREMAMDGKLPCEWSVEVRRFFTHPDIDIGWDSSRKCFVIGHDMYMFTDAKSGLPIIALLNPASMHDSFGLIETFYRLKSYLPDFMPKEMSLDSAHDVNCIYLMLARNGIVPYIDMNKRGANSVRLPSKFTLNEQSIPICPRGLALVEIGVDEKKGKTKFGCPCMEGSGKKMSCTCTCAEVCPKSKPRTYISVPSELLKCDPDNTAPGSSNVVPSNPETPATGAPATVPSNPEAPATGAPATVPSNPEAPATGAPATVPSNPEAPATGAPATVPSNSEAPATGAPATVPSNPEAPATGAPATVPSNPEAPATGAPATVPSNPEAPATGAPATAPSNSQPRSYRIPLKEPGFTMWQGSVLCPQGMEMKPNGTDWERGLAKFRCPMMSRDENGNPVCTCESHCEGGGKYGKDICVPFSMDPRYLTSPRRDTEKWEETYNNRTSSERDNKRVKIDWLFESAFTSNTMMCYISLYLIFIILHVTAQMEQMEVLKEKEQPSSKRRKAS